VTLRNLTIFGCSSQQPTRYRNQGGYLLRWGGEGFLIDPGEGTQRQFILAGVAPTAITRILISHFHGDHCMGLPAIFVCLNIHNVRHPIHCYYPASGKRFFDRLRFGTIYHDSLNVIEHPIKEDGWVEDDGQFKIEAAFLAHGIDNLGWRITEADQRKFHPDRLEQLGVRGPQVT
jgi:ribonuclease Z